MQIASSPVNSSARLVGTVGGAVTFALIHASFAVRHLEKEALSNQARSGRKEDACGRGYNADTFTFIHVEIGHYIVKLMVCPLTRLQACLT